MDFLLVFPGLAWWREIQDMPHDLWQACKEHADRQLGR